MWLPVPISDKNQCAPHGYVSARNFVQNPLAQQILDENRASKYQKTQFQKIQHFMGTGRILRHSCRHLFSMNFAFKRQNLEFIVCGGLLRTVFCISNEALPIRGGWHTGEKSEMELTTPASNDRTFSALWGSRMWGIPILMLRATRKHRGNPNRMRPLIFHFFQMIHFFNVWNRCTPNNANFWSRTWFS